MLHACPQVLAKVCQDLRRLMSTMDDSPEALKAFVDEQVDSRGFGTSSEHVSNN